MVYKNDTSDIRNFFLAMAAIIAVFVSISAAGLFFIGRKYGRQIHFFEAKICDYAQDQWEAGKKSMCAKPPD